MVGSSKKRKVAVKKGRVTAQLDEQTPNTFHKRKVVEKDNMLFTPPSTQTTTPQRIRTLDDLVPFTRSSRQGGTLERRFIEKESVDTPRQLTECAQISGTNLSPFLRNVELQNANTPREQHTDSQAGADDRNSPLKVPEAPNSVHIPLYSTSSSHGPKSTAKDVRMDETFKSALVPHGSKRGKSLHSSSATPILRGCQELHIANDDSDSLLQGLTGNLPDIRMGALPLYVTQGNDHSAESIHRHHSQPSVPTNTQVILPEDNGSSSTNINGSKAMAAKTNEPPQSISLDTTQIIDVMGNSDFADSAGASNTLVHVNGYKVKPQYAGLLTSIISKHGDIGANCSMVSGAIRSMCMEHVCDIVESLKKTDLRGISGQQLETMIGLVDDLEKDKVNVGWLRSRLDKISEAKKAIPQLMQSSKLTQLHIKLSAKVQSVKQLLEKYKEQREEHERAVFDLQKKIDSTKPLLAEAETEVTDTENLMTEIKTNLKRVYKLRSLAHDLV